MARNGTNLKAQRARLRNGNGLGLESDVRGSRTKLELVDSGRIEGDLIALITNAFASSHAYRETLDSLAAVVVPRLADYFMVELLQDNVLAPIIIKHSDPAREQCARQLYEKFQLGERGSGSGAWQAIARHSPVLTPEMAPGVSGECTLGQEAIDAFAELQVASRVHVPMIGRDDNLVGVLTFFHSESGRRYNCMDVALLEDLGRRAAFVVEHSLLQTELEKKVQDFRHLFEANPEPMWVFDSETLAFLEVNESAIERYGYTRDEFRSMTIVDIRPAEDVPLLQAKYATERKRTSVPETDWRHKKKDGEIIYASIATHAIEYVGRQARLVVAHDVTARVRAEQNLARKMSQLSSLHTIDQAIAGSLDLNVTLGAVLEQVLTQLEVDAVQVLILNQTMQTLQPVAGRGFLGRGVLQRRLRLGEGHAGRAARDRVIVRAADLGGESLVRWELIEEENFVSYVAAPLIAKGQVHGVLEIFHRSGLEMDPDWMSFLETLAGQTAIAVDNLAMFERLQRANTELALAYDATIEGWAKALDLRDRQTHDHSRRLAELTSDLAVAMGMDDSEVMHLRRGALLHDIGKMAVPDAILHKPGSLTDDEMAVVRQHPVRAQELLSPIHYLRPALAIPYSHHEHWDGGGYPLGLMGPAIPLAARIFAVVDVFDALTSQRPYRKAWSREEALEYIKERAGQQFDPDVVRRFLALMGAQAD